MQDSGPGGSDTDNDTEIFLDDNATSRDEAMVSDSFRGPSSRTKYPASNCGNTTH